MKFAKRYRLLKDTPTHPATSELIWEGAYQRFYFTRTDEHYESDRDGPSFTVEQMQDAQWFEPMEKLRPFIPPFPVRRKIGEYVRLDAECRMVDSVDECRAINALIADAGFQQRLYDFYRSEYNKFHGLKSVKE